MVDRSLAKTEEQAFVQANLRRNFVVLSLEMGFFGLGLTLASLTTIISAFATRLGASNLVIGALPAMQTIGLAMPALFTANFVERKPRMLPFILGVTIFERLPYLLLAVVALLLAESQPATALALTLSVMALAYFSMGLAMPPWLELVAKAIPSGVRGRFFGLGSLSSGLLGIGGAALVGVILTAFPFPLGYALCFTAAFAAMAASFVFLAAGREYPVESAEPRTRLRDYLRSLPSVLSSDRNFLTLLGGRALGMASVMGQSFFTVFALTRLGAEDGHVGTFTFFMLAGQTASTVFYGWIADRYGHRVVLMLGALTIALANVIALRASDPEHMYFAFAAMGASLGATSVSHFGILLAFGEAKGRLTYVGLGNTLLSPLAFAAQLIGGALADHIGYGVVFGVSALLAALSLVVLGAFVREPGPSRDPLVAETETSG